MSKGANVTPSVALPQGGGALRGMGEKFSPELFTGTGNLVIPIQTPAGRNQLSPGLSLAYSTGQGNGLFGVGWAVGLPEIMRSTSHGLPIYVDTKDVFVFSGQEDLVPLPAVSGQPQGYRPRTEGIFARIEHTRTSSEDFWKVTTKEGLTSYYGTPRANSGTSDPSWVDPAVLRDPTDTNKLFAWRLTRTTDPFGNRIDYIYVHDQGTQGPHSWDAPLLKEIRYIDYGDPAAPSFLVKVVFDYEDRPDPFSSYRAGFEVRTTKRCRNIAVQVNSKVQTTYVLSYDQALNGLSHLVSVLRRGFDATGNSTDLPPITFSYSQFQPQLRKLIPIEVPQLPVGSLLSAQYDLVDVSGKGLPDILQLSATTARYWQNLGDGTFSLPRSLSDVPAGLDLGSPGVALLDADGNGQLDLVVTTATVAGVFPMRFGGKWDARSFRPYQYAPSFNLKDPAVKLVDLDGDGVVDAIRSEADSLVCFFQDPIAGWKDVRRIPRKSVESFPDVSFSDPHIRWASMCGDGLQDIVLISMRSISYWPSRGRGQWGRRIQMQNSPHLPVNFDPRRVLIGDVDGDGCADVLYVEDGRVTLWLNRQGEGFGAPIVIEGTPSVTDQDSARLIDLLGTGTAGILWVRAPLIGRRDLFFLDLTGGSKPYLLTQMDNHLGAQTRVSYAPSTRYFLQDEKNQALRWTAPLPFPVQVVARTEIIDQISGSRLVSEFSYHHGYWDGADREFRGFGRVDQRDSEKFLDYYQRSTGFDKVSEGYFAPPIETRHWFHQGPQGDAFGIWSEADYSREFWAEDPAILRRPAVMQSFLLRLPRRAQRDALRALRGQNLRTEVYALDGNQLSNRPYTVTESLHAVSDLPGNRPPDEKIPASPSELSADDWRLRVFFPFQIAQRTSQWERGSEPLVSFHFTGKYDSFGQTQEQIAIAVPRSRATSHQQLVATDSSVFSAMLTRTQYAYSATTYLTGRTAAVRTYAVANAGAVSVPDLYASAQSLSNDLDAGTAPAGLKLLSETRNYYDGAAFLGLSLGSLGNFGALSRSEQLVMDDIQLAAAFGTNVPPFLTGGTKPTTWPQEYWDSVSNLAGYTKEGTRYYMQTSRVQYDFQDISITNPRGNLLQSKDPMGRLAKTQYDAAYLLFPVQITDPAGLITSAEHDFHFLQPNKITDANGNISLVSFTPLGLVNERFVRGKTTAEGDQTKPSELYIYDFSQVPSSVRVTRRQYHDSDTDASIPTGHKDDVLQVQSYSDGFGRIVQVRSGAETLVYGTVPLGGGILDPNVTNGAVTGTLSPTIDASRVVVSEFKRYDNKGRVVETAEPYYDSGFVYQAPTAQGALVKTFYDPLSRVVRMATADGSEKRILRGTPPIVDLNPVLDDPDAFSPSPWEVWTYDANDNAGRDLSARTLDINEDLSRGRAARAAFLSHIDTPSNVVLDALGRAVTSTQRLAKDSSMGNWITYQSVYDLLGNLLEYRDKVGTPSGRLVTSAVYDYLSRPLKTTSLDAGERFVLRDAADMPVYVTDGRGALTLSKSDSAGRPQKTWATDMAGEPVTLRVVLQYGDQSIPDDATRTVRRNNNLLGRLMTQRDEAGQLSFAAYDFKGNISSRSRQVIKDDAIMAVFAGLPAAGKWTVLPYRVDWSKSMADADLDSTIFSTDAGFDALNRVKWTLYPAPGGTRSKLVPTFNEAGALRSLALDGFTLIEHIGYNAKGQRSLMVDCVSKKAGTIDGRVLVRYAYDATTSRLVRMRSESCTIDGSQNITPESNPYQDTGYVYDRAGNLWKILDRIKDSGVSPTRDALDRLFSYDALYRLLSATGRETQFQKAPVPAELLSDSGPWNNDVSKAQGYTETYSYDEVGFMTAFKRTSHTSGGPVVHTRTFSGFTAMPGGANLTNQLKSVTFPDPSPTPGPSVTLAYTYDAAGNCLAEGSSRHFEWDHARRMRSFRIQTSDTSEPTQYVHYLYDSSGQRVKKLNRLQKGKDWSVTIYIDGIFEQIIQVRGGSTKVGQVLHLLDGQKRIGRRRTGETFDKKPDNLLLLGDYLSSTNVEIDWSKGSLVDREEFRPFGETSFGSYDLKRYRFMGKERDDESGLYYHGARYYAPGLARWMSCDPTGILDGTNLYQFVRNNPIRYIDPTGQKAASPDQQYLDLAQREVIQKNNSDINALLKQGLKTTDKLQVLQSFSDLTNKEHVVQLQLQVALGNHAQTLPGDPRVKDGITYHPFIMTLPGLIHPDLAKTYVSELASHLYHESLHIIINRDISLSEGEPKSKTYQEYKALLDAANGPLLTKEREALTANQTSPERAKKAIEFAVQELYVSRKTAGVFNVDASNSNIVQHYKGEVAERLTGIPKNRLPAGIERGVGRTLLDFYDKLSAQIDSGTGTTTPALPSPASKTSASQNVAPATAPGPAVPTQTQVRP